jgi:amino acid adenylation domain-containing protein
VEDADALDASAEVDPPTRSGPDDLAYVIYTSGSTGQPKGAMVTGANLESIYRSYEREYRLRELRGHAQMASFSFDVFTGDVIRALPAGAKLVLCPHEVVLDPARLYELWEHEGVDAVELVPAVAGLLFDHLEATGQRLHFMRFIAIGGEPWRTDRFARYRQLCGEKTRLVNSYGLTEVTMDSTYFEPGPDTELVAGRFMPIGTPLPGTRLYVLDERLEPQPIGIPGELCIAGPGVCAGYLGRPELTAERFVADPFVEGERMYRTGDLARWLPDGTIEFVGRRDRQLKIRGFRIEPGEIESVLERHPRVGTAAVAVHEDESGSPALVAYLTPAGDKRPAPDELRSYVAEYVPAYMVPAAWMVLEQLPTTPNGKVDVAALPVPEFDRAASVGEFLAPQTDSEKAIAAIWSDMLGIEQIGVGDNFFALGGHSLLAVRLFAQIESRLGVKLPLASLFGAGTVGELARLVDEERSGRKQSWSSVVPMRPQEKRPPFFLVGWVGGQLIGYRTLVDQFPDTVSVYGLQAPGLDGSRLPLSTIEGLAAHYISEIRRVQPHGPYYIGGFCFAGVVAYEMARQLSEQGEELGMVALIDSYLRGTRPLPSRAETRRQHLVEFRQAGAAGRIRWLAERIRVRSRRLLAQTQFKTGYLALDVLERTGLPIPRRPWNLVLVASSKAAQRYHAQPADVRVEFFRPQREPGEAPTPWDNLARRGVVVRPVIGEGLTHDSLTSGAGVPRLVEVLHRALNEALDAGQAAGTLRLASFVVNGHGNGHGNGNGSGNGPANVGSGVPLDGPESANRSHS